MEWVMEAFDFVAAAFVKAHDAQLLHVARGGPLRGGPGPAAGNAAEFSNLSLDELRRAVWATGLFPYAVVGQIVVKMRGLAIGGLTSRPALAMELAASEARWNSLP